MPFRVHIYLSKEKYFSNKEYLRGDLVFIYGYGSCFQKDPNATLSEEQKYFNTKLAKVEIKSEHCIGLPRLDFNVYKSLGGL